MDKKTISWLELKDMRILKQIILISNKAIGDYEVGQILYTRPLSKEYRFKKLSNEEKETNSFDRMFNNDQNKYPVDKMDLMILDAVKSKFPKSVCNSDTILFNTDIEKLLILKNKQVSKSIFHFQPAFESFENIITAIGNKYSYIELPINIYC
jgi:predicted aldo/keto reductase-like oxidoreductase